MNPASLPVAEPLRVLVVEDEVLTRMALAAEFRRAGLRVIEAATADEAWSFLQAGGEADLVFSDLQMPGQRDGLDLAAALRGLRPGTPFVLASGTMTPAQAAAVEWTMPKPYAPDQATALVLRILGAERG